VLPEAVLAEMHARDQRDRTRPISPLVPAPGAVVIDSTALTIEQVLARVEALVGKALAEKSQTSA
jgi:cytidylate kinase